MSDIEKAIKHFTKRNFWLKANPVCQRVQKRVDKQNYEIQRNDLAILALEKQIPKKPCEVVDESGWEDWACPECGALIEGGSVMLHCWSCGQKLDWRVKE